MILSKSRLPAIRDHAPAAAQWYREIISRPGRARQRKIRFSLPLVTFTTACVALRNCFEFEEIPHYRGRVIGKS